MQLISIAFGYARAINWVFKVAFSHGEGTQPIITFLIREMLLKTTRLQKHA